MIGISSTSICVNMSERPDYRRITREQFFQFCTGVIEYYRLTVGMQGGV